MLCPSFLTRLSDWAEGMGLHLQSERLTRRKVVHYHEQVQPSSYTNPTQTLQTKTPYIPHHQETSQSTRSPPASQHNNTIPNRLNTQPIRSSGSQHSTRSAPASPPKEPPSATANKHELLPHVDGSQNSSPLARESGDGRVQVGAEDEVGVGLLGRRRLRRFACAGRRLASLRC